MSNSLPPEIHQLFQQLRRKIRLYLAVEGGGIWLFRLGILFWISLILDRFLEPAPSIRLVFLVCAILFVLWDFGKAVLWPIFRPLSDHVLAILLERSFPQLNDSLLTLVEPEKKLENEISDEEILLKEQFSTGRDVQNQSESSFFKAAENAGTDSDSNAKSNAYRSNLLNQIHQELLPVLETLKVRSLFRTRPLLLGILGAFLMLASVSGFAVKSPELLQVWSNRVFLLSETPWPRKVQIEMDSVFHSGILKAARGSDVKIRLRAGVTDPQLRLDEVLRTVYFSYRTEDGIRDRAAMERENETFTENGEWADFSYTFRGVLKSFDFEITAGDASVRNLRVEVVDSPSLSMDLRLEYPAYSALTPQNVKPGAVQAVPVGTKVTFFGKSNKPLTAVDLQILNADGTSSGWNSFTWSSPAETASSKTSKEIANRKSKKDSDGKPASESGSGSNRDSNDLSPSETSPKSASGKSQVSQTANAIVEEFSRGQIEKSSGTKTFKPQTADSTQIEIPFGILKDDAILLFTLHDADGITSPAPIKLVLAIEEDSLPALAVNPWGIGEAVTPNAFIPMKGSISDDYGLKRVGFGWQTERPVSAQTELQKEPLQESSPADANAGVPAVTPAEKAQQNAETPNGQNPSEAPSQPPAGFRWLTHFDSTSNPPLEFSLNGSSEMALELSELHLLPGDQFQFFMAAEDRNDLEPASSRQNHSQTVNLQIVTPEQLRWRLEGREVVLGQLFDAIFAEMRDSRETLDSLTFEAAPQETPVEESKPETASVPGKSSETAEEKANENVSSVENEEETSIQAIQSYRVERLIQNHRKNSHEFNGIAEGVQNLCLQMVHNRIDSPAWHERLDDGVRKPLLEVHLKWIPELEVTLTSLRKAIDANETDRARTLHAEAAKQMDSLLILLAAVREKMLKMQDFNEMAELLRSVIRQEEELQTEITRKNRSGLADLLADDEEDEEEEDTDGEEESDEESERNGTDGEEASKDEDSAEETLEEELSPQQLADQQNAILRTFKLWEEKIPQMLEMLRNDSDRSELLKNVRQMSDEARISTRMESIAEQLAEESYSQANAGTKKLIPDLKKLLEKLESENRNQQILNETERLRAHLKELNQRIREQQSLEGRTRQARDVRELSREQGENAQKTADLAQKISDQTQESEAHSANEDVEKAESQEKPANQGQSKAQDSSKTPEGESSGKESDKEKSDKAESNEEESGENSEEELKDSEKSPLSQALKRAQKRMEQAKRQMEQTQREGALEEQKKALEELEEAKAELEKVLRQLREEEKKRTLALLETQLKELIQFQQGILEDTKRLDGIPKEKRTQEFTDETIRLSRRERDLTQRSGLLLNLLREDGRARMMAEILTETISDMNRVTELLSKGNADSITIGIETDILSALEEMLAAVEEAERKMKEEEQENGQEQQENGAGEQDPALIDQIAELKLIRAAQVRIWRRTQTIGKQISEEVTKDPLHLEILKDLSRQQEKIRKIVHEMAAEEP